MRVSKKLTWMKPYIKIAQSIVPEVGRITRVLALNVDKNLEKNPAALAKITEYSDRTYVISLYTEYVAKEKIHPEAIFSIEKLSKIDILCNLAHEIAHLRSWEHTPARQILESSLVIAFMGKLNSSGYISAEKTDGLKEG